MTFVSRDGFARQEIHKTEITVAVADSCDWCGGAALRGDKRKLFSYRTESDGGRKSNISGHFCCVPCMRAFHDL